MHSSPHSATTPSLASLEMRAAIVTPAAKQAELPSQHAVSATILTNLQAGLRP